MTHLDTNIVVAHFRGDRHVADRLHAAVPNLAISSIVYGELLFGAKLSNRPADNLEKIAKFIAIAPVVPFDELCASQYSEIKLHLRRMGKPTGEPDALIAATALACSATLVTNNVKDFENVPGLTVENWLAG